MEKYTVLPFFIYFLIISDYSTAIKYNKWRLIKIQPLNSTESRNNLIAEIETLKNVKIIDNFRENILLGLGPAAESEKNLRKIVEKRNLNLELLHEDISRLIKPQKTKWKRSIQDDAFDRYMNLDQMEDFFQVLATSYPERVKLKLIGQSYEGRNISLLVISSNNPFIPIACPNRGLEPIVSTPSVNSNRLRGSQSVRESLRRRVLLHRSKRQVSGPQRLRRRHLGRQQRSRYHVGHENPQKLFQQNEFSKNLVPKQPLRRQPLRRHPFRRQPISQQPIRRQPIRRKPLRRQPIRREELSQPRGLQEASQQLSHLKQTPANFGDKTFSRELAEEDGHHSLFVSRQFVENMRAQKTRRNSVQNKSKKPIIFIDAGMHSREWVAPAAALYLIKTLAESPYLTAYVDWYVVPMINPDGYKFSWEYDRFWRKTRSQSGVSGCYGADMNRNFNHRWGEVDTSQNPCSEHYGGNNAESETETETIKNIITSEKNRIKAYISLHNWGQDIVLPFCHSAKIIPNTIQQLERVSKGMSDAIEKSQGKKYRTGRGSVILYPASGTSVDWAYDAGVPYTYLLELRDKLGLLGFILPETYIRPTGEDLVAAMKYLSSELMKESEYCV